VPVELARFPVFAGVGPRIRVWRSVRIGTRRPERAFLSGLPLLMPLSEKPRRWRPLCCAGDDLPVISPNLTNEVFKSEYFRGLSQILYGRASLEESSLWRSGRVVFGERGARVRNDRPVSFFFRSPSFLSYLPVPRRSELLDRVSPSSGPDTSRRVARAC